MEAAWTDALTICRSNLIMHVCVYLSLTRTALDLVLWTTRDCVLLLYPHSHTPTGSQRVTYQCPVPSPPLSPRSTYRPTDAVHCDGPVHHLLQRFYSRLDCPRRPLLPCWCPHHLGRPRFVPQRIRVHFYCQIYLETSEFYSDDASFIMCTWNTERV